MALDFPNSPSLNDTYTSSGRTWQWNGTVWEAVTTGISANSISTTDLADDAVTTAKISNLNVTTAKIADENITAGKLATDAVTTTKIQNSAVTVAKLATAAQPGLVLIKAQTIGTAVSSIPVTDVFSSDYENYVIMVTGGAGSTAASLKLTFDSVNTGYYYYGNYGVFGTGSIAYSTQANTTSFADTFGVTTNAINGYCEVYGPNLAKTTQIIYRYVYAQTSSGLPLQGGGFLNSTNQHTAFTLTTSTGTVTGGTIRVYGFRNS